MEEIFGPVTCVTVFDTEAEVVERVNNTRCVYIFWLLGGLPLLKSVPGTGCAPVSGLRMSEQFTEWPSSWRSAQSGQTAGS